jgi:hypothetical protein
MLFVVSTPLDFAVHCYRDYWERKIVAQHPVMQGREQDVIAALQFPMEVRRSRWDTDVFLFYTQDSIRMVCAVARKLDADGFLITAYPTDKAKEGERIWTR